MLEMLKALSAMDLPALSPRDGDRRGASGAEGGIT
jgi:hypothetical protein